MKNFLQTLLGLSFILLFSSNSWADSSILTIKPFFQFNDEFSDTYGIEVGYWPHQAFKNTDLYLGYDFGLLGAEGVLESYADAQLGSRVVGVGAGPYIVIKDEFHTGLQFNAWINLFAGFNFKYRWNPLDPIGSSTAFYIAVPLLLKSDR